MSPLFFHDYSQHGNIAITIISGKHPQPPLMVWAHICVSGPPKVSLSYFLNLTYWMLDQVTLRFTLLQSFVKYQLTKKLPKKKGKNCFPKYFEAVPNCSSCSEHYSNLLAVHNLLQLISANFLPHIVPQFKNRIWKKEGRPRKVVFGFKIILPNLCSNVE